jgi:hypothetical protein
LAPIVLSNYYTIQVFWRYQDIGLCSIFAGYLPRASRLRYQETPGEVAG